MFMIMYDGDHSLVNACLVLEVKECGQVPKWGSTLLG